MIVTKKPNPHSDLVKACQQLIALIPNSWQMKVMGGMGQRPGIVDILAGIPRKVYIVVPLGPKLTLSACETTVSQLLAVEVKTGRGKLSEAQKEEMERIRQTGGIAIEVRKLEDLSEVLEQLTGRRLDLK